MIPTAHLGSFVIAPLQLVPLVLLAIAYTVRANTLAGRGQPVAVWRQACFATGLVVIFLALASPLASVNSELFLAHMSQHLLLADIAALLLVLGVTGPLLQPLLARPLIGRLRVLAHPLVALVLWMVNLYVWHIPALYEATLTNDLLHALQHSCFLGFGILIWMPLFGPLPKPQWFGPIAMFLYILAIRFAGGILGNVFIWSPETIFPAYEPGAEHWGITAIADQGIAGSIMMIESIFLTVGLVVWLVIDFAKRDQRSQELIDYAEANGLELDPERARRAVRAGRSEELMERLRLRDPTVGA